MREQADVRHREAKDQLVDAPFALRANDSGGLNRC